MALVIETGAGIGGANSYATESELRAFASDRGITLPAEDGGCDALLIGAADYLNTRRWTGLPATTEQYLAWPRTGVTLYGISQDGLIPSQVKTSQMHLALEAQASGSLLTNTRPMDTKKVKIDVLAIEYFKLEETSGSIVVPIVDALLRPLLAIGQGAFITVRA